MILNLFIIVVAFQTMRGEVPLFFSHPRTWLHLGHAPGSGRWPRNGPIWPSTRGLKAGCMVKIGSASTEDAMHWRKIETSLWARVANMLLSECVVRFNLLEI